MTAPRVYLPASLGDLRALGDDEPHERGGASVLEMAGPKFLRPTLSGCQSPFVTGAGPSFVC